MFREFYKGKKYCLGGESHTASWQHRDRSIPWPKATSCNWLRWLHLWLSDNWEPNKSPHKYLPLRDGKRLLGTLHNILWVKRNTTNIKSIKNPLWTFLPNIRIVYLIPRSVRCTRTTPSSFQLSHPQHKLKSFPLVKSLWSASKSSLPPTPIPFICTDSFICTALAECCLWFFSPLWGEEKKKERKGKLQLLRVPWRRRKTDVSSYSPKIHNDQCLSSILLCPSCDCLIRCWFTQSWDTRK